MNIKTIILVFSLGTLLACGSGGENTAGYDPIPPVDENFGGGGEITPPELLTIAITTVKQKITLGETLQFDAIGTYSDNSTQNLTNYVTWTSSDVTVATINSAGLATSHATGSTLITATSGTFAVNTTMTVQDVLAVSPFGYHPAEVEKQGYNNNGYGDASNIGVAWTRPGLYAFWFTLQPDLASQTYDFSQFDQELSRVPAGMNILANIAPQGPNDEGRNLTASYFPVDEQQYISFVKAVLQRYSGDSYAAVGLAAPIKYWQVGNEPNNQTTSDFADLHRITYTAIKEVCPDCVVLIGGMGGMPPVDNYQNLFDLQYKPILNALNGQYVDVMDFHWYGTATGDYRGAKDVYDHIRGALDGAGFPALPIWITEMGSYSGDPMTSPVSSIDYPLQTEQQQAQDYFKRFIYSLSFGVGKIFPAFGLMEGFSNDGGYFDFTGLIYNGRGRNDLGLGIKKLGYYTYKKMTEMLEGSDWQNIQTIQQSDNTYIFKFTRNNTPLYVLWWDYFDEPLYSAGDTKTVTIPSVSGTSALVTEMVPKFQAGNDVTNYATAFNSQTISISGGTASFTIAENPVIVEFFE